MAQAMKQQVIESVGHITSEIRQLSEMAVASCNETCQEFQMNKWLGKFWGLPIFGIAMIGDRESLNGPSLRRLLGEDCDTEYFQFPEPPSSSVGSRNSHCRDFVEGVEVYATLIPALSDAPGYKDEEYFAAARIRVEFQSLVFYCIDMSDTRLRGSVLRTLQKLKTDWSRTVILLTFADALPALLRHRRNPAFPADEYFNTKVAEWTGELKAMLERIGVQQEVIAKIKIYPIATDVEDRLPNGELWLPPLSLAIMEILSPEKKAAFLEEHATLLPTVTVAAKPLETLSLSVSTAAELMATMHVSKTTEVQSSKSNVRASSVSSGLSEDQSRSIRDALSKLRKDCPEFGILVIGRTGVGKSTLINNLLGKEVASVGHGLQSETPNVHRYKDSVEEVPIVVYDTPGLGDVKSEEDEKLHLEIIENFLATNIFHLVVYCFQMNDTMMTSSLVGAIQKYNQIGVDWERSVIALTFADALYVPKREWERRYFKMGEFFEERLAYWQRELRRELNKVVCAKSGAVEQQSDAVEQQSTCPCLPRLFSRQRRLRRALDTDGGKSAADVVERLKICPTSLLPTDQLPNGNPWYVPLWLHIVEILSPAATVRFLGMHRNNISGEHAPAQQSKRVKLELQLSKDDKNRLTNTIALTIEAAGMDNSEVIRALSEAGIGEILKLFAPEQASQSESEPLVDSQAVLLRFKSFGDRFVKDVHSRGNIAFIAKLCRHEVIPESLKNQIAAAADGETANELLFEHLSKQATCESLSKLLAAMIEAEGHSAMTKLGREIKKTLGL